MANSISQAHEQLTRPLTRGYKRRHQELDFDNAEFRKGKFISGLEEQRPTKAKRTAARRTPAPAHTEQESVDSGAVPWASTLEYQELRKLGHELSFLEEVLQRSAERRVELALSISGEIWRFAEYQEDISPWTGDDHRDGDPEAEDNMFEAWDSSRVLISQWCAWIKVLQSREADLETDMAAKKLHISALRESAVFTPEQEQALFEGSPTGLLADPEPPIPLELLENETRSPPKYLHGDPRHRDDPVARLTYKLLTRLSARLLRLTTLAWRDKPYIATIKDLGPGGYDGPEDSLFALWRSHTAEQVSRCKVAVERLPTFLEQCHYEIFESLHGEAGRLRVDAWERYGMYTTADCVVALVEDGRAASLPLLEPCPIPETVPACLVSSPEEKVQEVLGGRDAQH